MVYLRSGWIAFSQMQRSLVETEVDKKTSTRGTPACYPPFSHHLPHCKTATSVGNDVANHTAVPVSPSFIPLSIHAHAHAGPPACLPLTPTSHAPHSFSAHPTNQPACPVMLPICMHPVPAGSWLVQYNAFWYLVAPR